VVYKIIGIRYTNVEIETVDGVNYETGVREEVVVDPGDFANFVVPYSAENLEVKVDSAKFNEWMPIHLMNGASFERLERIISTRVSGMRQMQQNPTLSKYIGKFLGRLGDLAEEDPDYKGSSLSAMVEATGILVEEMRVMVEGYSPEQIGEVVARYGRVVASAEALHEVMFGKLNEVEQGE